MPSFQRYIFYFLICLIALVAGTSAVSAAVQEDGTQLTELNAIKADLINYEQGLGSLATLKTAMAKYSDEGVDIANANETIITIKSYLDHGQYFDAIRLNLLTTEDLQNKSAQIKADKLRAEELKSQQEAATKKQLEEEEKQRGDIQGIVTSGKFALVGATVKLLLGDSVAATVLTDSLGGYSFHQSAGFYNVSAERSGYIKQQKDQVGINPQQVTTIDFSLDKVPTKPVVVAAPKQPSVTDESTAHSTYRQTTVATERGTFTVRLLTLDLGSGKIKVITDTANDSDCATDCSVKSVKQYVSDNGGFAGINGTYFCPTSYGASCAGKTNSYFWKVYNTRLQTVINRNNGLGENDPYLVFDAHGRPKFFNSWNDSLSSSFPIYAGINHKPFLVKNGQVILTDAAMDDKERTAHITRASLGLKGETLYVAVVSGATVGDLASVMQAIGAENAINIDGGGSSGLYYNGTYKSGPGRNVPNALVFVEVP